MRPSHTGSGPMYFYNDIACRGAVGVETATEYCTQSPFYLNFYLKTRTCFEVVWKVAILNELSHRSCETVPDAPASSRSIYRCISYSSSRGGGVVKFLVKTASREILA